MAPDIKIFLTVTLICNGPLKFLCLGSKIIQNHHFHFKCAMSCSKRILICSTHILNMREQLYFHHKGQLCSSMHLHDKIEQLPPYFECAQSSTWRFHDVARAPNWESAIGNSPLLKGRCHEIFQTQFFSSICSFWSYQRYPSRISYFDIFSRSYGPLKLTPRWCKHLGVNQKGFLQYNF